MSAICQNLAGCDEIIFYYLENMQNKNYQYIAGLVRTLAGTNAENYADDELVIDMNIVREDMHTKVVAKGKSNPYWDEAVLDIIE